MLILLALRVASVATFALFQVLLPILFTFIPIAGRRERMLRIGEAGQRGLGVARAHIRHQFLGGPAPYDGLSSIVDEPVAPDTNDLPQAEDAAPRPRQRISIDAVADELEAEADELEARLERPPRNARE